MKKQLPAIVLAIACIALLAAYLNANKNIKQLQEEIAQLQSPNAAGTETLIESGGIPSDGAGTDSAVPAAPVNDPETATEKTESGGRRMMESMAKMMENPTMNKVMEASQRGAVGALYSDLIEYLKLDEEETKYFMDLLMYRHMKQVDMSMKMMSGTLSDEERETLTREVEEAGDLARAEMEKFLNDEADFSEFEYYEKTMSERMMLSQMDQDLSNAGTELSDATYRELLGVMHDERESFDFTSNLHDQDNPDISPERFSKDNVQNYASDVEKLNDAICLKAESILTPEQYEAFVASLKTFTDMQLAQLEMAAQMFGGGE